MTNGILMAIVINFVDIETKYEVFIHEIQPFTKPTININGLEVAFIMGIKALGSKEVYSCYFKSIIYEMGIS